MIHEFWAGRVGPYPPASSAVVVQAAEEETPAPPLVATAFASTGPEVAAAEDLVLAELAALIADRESRRSPWEACQTLFGPAALPRPGGDGSGSRLASTQSLE